MECHRRSVMHETEIGRTSAAVGARMPDGKSDQYNHSVLMEHQLKRPRQGTLLDGKLNHNAS